jgi:hypothetical protein
MFQLTTLDVELTMTTTPQHKKEKPSSKIFNLHL